MFSEIKQLKLEIRNDITNCTESKRIDQNASISIVHGLNMSSQL